MVFDVLIIFRFKQIKEQEARIRQQREEEKRKAEEAAKLESQTINDSDKSAAARFVVNGSLSRQDMEEVQNSMSTSTMLHRTDVDDEVSDTSEPLPSVTQEEVNPC